MMAAGNKNAGLDSGNYYHALGIICASWKRL